jgi:hypothetical protein
VLNGLEGQSTDQEILGQETQRKTRHWSLMSWVGGTVFAQKTRHQGRTVGPCKGGQVVGWVANEDGSSFGVGETLGKYYVVTPSPTKIIPFPLSSYIESLSVR